LRIFRTAAFLLVMVFVLAAGSHFTARPAFPAAPGQPAAESPEYTVASTEMRSVATAAPSPVSISGDISEKLVLLGVGTLLLGLAAAVRRTV
jgi:hypothetical protein